MISTKGDMSTAETSWLFSIIIRNLFKNLTVLSLFRLLDDTYFFGTKCIVSVNYINMYKNNII